MPLIQYAATAPLCQVEGFPATKKGEGDKPGPGFGRSCEGALHLRPGATLPVTADELDFIRKERKDIARSIRVLVDDPPEAPAQPAPAQASAQAAAPEAAASDAPAAEQPADGGDAPKKSGKPK
jgi:hypothetical protein